MTINIIAGTPNFPDLESYCKKVHLEDYDTFLILSACRFTQSDFDLAKEVRAMEKSFFFVRTKIDIDVWNNKKTKNVKEDVTLSTIREECLAGLRSFGADDEMVFLISNHEHTKWDFDRLTVAILDGLPVRHKESLTLSLLTQSKDLLKRKADVLRGNFNV